MVSKVLKEFQKMFLPTYFSIYQNQTNTWGSHHNLQNS